MAITDTAANPIAFEEAKERGLDRLALVGMRCQTSVGRPGDDPGAIALMHRLSAKSRARWPGWADGAARLGLPERAKR